VLGGSGIDRIEEWPVTVRRLPFVSLVRNRNYVVFFRSFKETSVTIFITQLRGKEIFLLTLMFNVRRFSSFD